MTIHPLTKSHSSELTNVGQMRRDGYSFRLAGNDPEVGTRGLIGLGGALLPIPERAEGNLKAGGKFLLREAERAPDQLGARRVLHVGELGGGKRPGVGIGAGGGFDLGRRHTPHGAQVRFHPGCLA
jgi:hypothetical protein